MAGMSDTMYEDMARLTDHELIKRMAGVSPGSAVFETGRALLVSREIQVAREMAASARTAMWVTVTAAGATVAASIATLVSVIA